MSNPSCLNEIFLPFKYIEFFQLYCCINEYYEDLLLMWLLLNKRLMALVMNTKCSVFTYFSNSNPWVPTNLRKMGDAQFTDFVEGLGPAQMVGRQVLGIYLLTALLATILIGQEL